MRESVLCSGKIVLEWRGHGNWPWDQLNREESMHKTDLVSAVAKEADLSQVQSTKAVDAVITAITKALKSGDKVTITGFGTFEVRKTAARTGTNPATNSSRQTDWLQGRQHTERNSRREKSSKEEVRLSCRETGTAARIARRFLLAESSLFLL